MSSLGRITVEIDADDRGFSATIRRAGQQLGTFRSETDRAHQGVERANRGMHTLASTIRDFTVITSLASGALQNIRSIMFGWAEGIAKTSARVERMTFLMKGMADASSGMSAWKQAERDVKWIFDFTKSAPFNLETLTKSFVKLKSAGIDPLGGSMKALVDGVAAFGGDAMNLERASIAVQQMAGKGVISMEELRQQFGEAVPRAIQIMARSMDMTVGELVDKISKGAVEAKPALERLFAEMDRTFGGSAVAMMQTLGGQFQALQSNWQEFQVAVGSAGFNRALTDTIREMNAVLDGKGATNFAATLGKAMGEGVIHIRNLAVTLYELREQILEVGKVLLFAFGASRALAIIGNLRGAIIGLAAPLAAVRAAFVATAASGATMGRVVPYVTRTTAALGYCTVAGQGLAASFRLAGVAASALFGPIGLLLLGIYELAQAFDVFGTKGKDAWDKVIAGQAEYLSDKEMAKATERLEELKAELNSLNKPGYVDSQIAAAKANGVGGLTAEHFANERKRLAKEIADFEVKAEEDKIERVNRANTAAVSRAVGIAGEGVAAIKAQYDEELMAYEKSAEYKAQSGEQRNAARVAIVQKYGQQEVDYWQKQIDTVAAAEIKADEAGRARLGEQRKVFVANLNAANAALRNTAPLTLWQGAEGKPTGGTNADNTLATLKARLADVKAEIAGESGLTAKYRELYTMGKLVAADGKPIGPTALAEILQVTDEINRLTDANRALKKAQEGARQAGEWLASSWESMSEKAETLSNKLLNPGDRRQTDAYLSFVQQSEKRLEAIRALNDPRQTLAAEAEVDHQRTTFRQNEVRETVIAMQEKTKQISFGLMNERAGRWAAFNDEVERLRQEVDAKILSDDEKVIAEQAFQEHVRALRAQTMRATESETEKLIRHWSDATTRMGEMQAAWASDATDLFVNMATTGKISFKGLITSMIGDLLRLQLQAKLLTAFNALFNAIGNYFTGGVTSGSTPITIGGGAGTAGGATLSGMRPSYHTGGIVGVEAPGSRSIPDSLFANAHRFHTGGIAGDEVPIIAQKGEGVFTEGQMKALGSGSAPNVKIEVINQSGKDVEAEQQAPRFDGEAWVLTTVLRAASSPGGFRTNLKTALSR